MKKLLVICGLMLSGCVVEPYYGSNGGLYVGPAPIVVAPPAPVYYPPVYPVYRPVYRPYVRPVPVPYRRGYGYRGYRR